MPPSYVETTRADFEALLTAAKGWSQTTSGRELVFEYRVRSDPRILIRVLTGLEAGSGTGRGCGQDAIRIVGVFFPGPGNKGARGLYKATRTHRTANWRARVVERVTAAVNECKARVARPGPATGKRWPTGEGARLAHRTGPMDEFDFHEGTY